ncbi:MAG: FadR family transcriptional regulator [Anaerolineae bacterium]|nr:FadR family transcriptional regulator [Anaerolineae bacterium]
MVTQPTVFRAVGSKQKLVDRVVQALEELIISRQLEPDTKLPPERDLADQLGVSRTVLREAVRILVTKGLLETQPGKGTLVRKLTREQVVEPLSLLLRNHTSGEISFDQLYQVRSILEVEIAGLAALQASEADIAQLKQIVANMEATQNDVVILAVHDADFHSALAKMTHNPLLAILVDSIRDLLQEYVARVTPYLDPSQENLPLHQKLLERIEARDVAGARQAMRENLDQMHRNTERYAELSRKAMQPEG